MIQKLTHAAVCSVALVEQVHRAHARGKNKR